MANTFDVLFSPKDKRKLPKKIFVVPNYIMLHTLLPAVSKYN